MIRLDNFINLFIQSYHTDFIEFSTDNPSWPEELRFPAIQITNILTAIYKNTNYKNILEQRVKKVEQKIPYDKYAQTMDRMDIKQVNGYTLNPSEGLFLNGIDKEGRVVAARIVPVLEIVLYGGDHSTDECSNNS